MRHTAVMRRVGVSSKSAHSLIIICGRGEKPPEGIPVWEVSCLGGVDLCHLAGLAARGVREITVVGEDSCQACPSRYGSRVFRESVGQACAVLSTVEIPLTVAPPSRVIEGNSTTEQRPDGEIIYSRRDFFSTLRERLNPLRITEREVFDGPRDVILSKFQPEKMNFLINEMNGEVRGLSPKRDSEKLPFFLPDLTGDCNHCSLCSLFCPTGALLMVEQETKVSLTLESWRCTGCSLCVSVCPLKSLKLFRLKDMAHIFKRSVLTIYEKTRKTCSGCREQPVANWSSRYCVKCDEERVSEEFFEKIRSDSNDMGIISAS